MPKQINLEKLLQAMKDNGLDPTNKGMVDALMETMMDDTTVNQAAARTADTLKKRGRQLVEEAYAGSKLPEQIQKVHREHGLDPTKACRGCISLINKFTKPDGRTPLYNCTRWGADAEWQPDWPACKERNTPEPKQQAKARRPRGKQAA